MTTLSPITSPAACRTGERRYLLSYRRTMWLTIVLLVAVSVLSLGSLTGVLERVSPDDQFAAWSACGMLVSLAICILLIGRYMTQRSLQHVEQQLRALARNDDIVTTFNAPASDELRPVMTALSDYVTAVRHRVDQLRLQKKELNIQMRFANAERQNTEAIIRSISDAVLVLDSGGQLLMANESAEHLFVFRLTESQPRPAHCLIGDESLLALLRDAQTTARQWTRRQAEFKLKRSGRERTFQVTLSSIVNNQGESNGLVAVFHDITREREIGQIKTEFVSAVSHELRTPLSSITAYMEMLVDGEAHDEEERASFYRIIQTETDRLQRLVNNILNISRIESGVAEVRFAAVQARGVVADVLKTLAPQAAAKQITLDVELTEDLPDIWADHDLLHQAVMNVVGNAIKYTGPGGRVCVTMHGDPETSRVVVSVIDNGMGIHAEDLPRVFDKFYRTSESANVAKGTGLGLNLVKQIVETVHQGEISLASEHGVGTTVALRFPLMAEEVREAATRQDRGSRE